MPTHWPHKALAFPLRWMSLWSGDALRRARAVRKPRILMYHIIGGDELPVDQFEWQLDFLRRHFEPVALGALVERLRAGKTTGREVAITFDDGVRNQFNVAWPLLRKCEVPATFFVCSGLIESDRWMWRLELRLRLASLAGAERARAARAAGCDADNIEQLMEWTKTLSMPKRLAFEHQVAALSPQFFPTATMTERHAPLTWNQLLQLDERLITIGSHTRTHPILTTLSAAQLQQEIVGSKRELEQNLGRRVDLFCYPNGVNDSAVVELVRRHFRAAVCTSKDFVAPDADPFRLPRISGEGSRAMFVRRLHRPTS